MVQRIAFGNVQTTKCLTGNYRIDIFAFQFKLTVSKNKGRMNNSTIKNSPAVFGGRDKMSDALIDEDNIPFRYI